ncbi:MAG: response regulator transcription factor [Verrucomicrobia bacterium]|nr:response regulator transcription factor [Verrucomicrobiota bacterium]
MSNPATPIRVLVVDDSALVRHGIRAALATQLGPRPVQVAAEADSVASAVRLATETKPDVVLLDIRLPDGTGIDACREITQRLPETAVLMLTSFAGDALLYDSVVAGAKGYLMKEVDPAGLLDAITRAAEGRPVLTPDVAAKVMQMLRSGPPAATEADLSKLSLQERRVLALVATGRTNRAIGDELGLSENTVKNYLVNVFEKLRVKRRSQAAALFIQANADRK